MSAAADDAPSQLGRFEIRREIGRGTMGVVYEAQDPVLGRTVALKVIGLAVAGASSERSAFEQRFLAEARIAARLSHPGIVVIHDVGRDAGTGNLYMALEYLQGRTLEDLISGGRTLEWRETLRILARVAVALHHAHAQGVVHRDVKPANIMLLDSGDPKIMDFGIAKLVVEGHATSTGQLFGTPLYMAPEQARGEAVDARTDIFSLGAIAYSLLTGRRAFQASSIPTIIARVLHHDPPPLSAVAPGLPPDLDDLVARAMAKAPADRYPTAKDLAEDAEDILAGREPRHRAGWTPPAVGARTLVSSATGGGDLEEMELLEAPPTPAPTRLRRRARSDARPRFLAMVLLGGGIGIAAAGLLRFEVLPPEEASVPPPTTMAWSPPAASLSASPEPSPSAAAVEAAPSGTTPEVVSSPLEPAAGAAPPTPEPTPSPGPGPPAQAGEPEASPSPEAPSPAVPTAEASSPPAPPPSPSPPPARDAEKRAAESKDKARLAVHLDPALRAKSLRVWVDGKLLVDEKLGATAGKTQAPRAEAPLKVIPLSPGRRQVRVQVRDEDGLRGERLIVTLKAGVGRRLDVKAGRASTTLAFVLR
jgi:serine/threonine-protein kinase